MRRLKFLLIKEFRQIFRDKSLLRTILIAPLLQLLILPWAANYEIKNIYLSVVDHDHSTYSSKMIEKIRSSGYFKIEAFNSSYKQAYALVERDKADIIIEIPVGFERNLIKEGSQKVLLAVNAINGTKAVVGSGYLIQILQDYNNELRLKWVAVDRIKPLPQIEITSSNWYNPLMNYKTFMVPGILVMLVTMIGSMMCALNIVKEKEIGTIEQINVTPVRKIEFILGKLIPFWVLCMVMFSIGLLIAWLVYGIIPAGNIAVLYLFLAIYLVAVLGLGLLISTYSETQQQAMSISFFFIMLFNLLSGLFTPIESMPKWAQMIASLNPVSYFISVMRMVVLKGSSLYNIRSHIFIMILFALVINIWAIFNYRKRS